MSEEKINKARVVHKHKTEAEWQLDVYDGGILREDPFIPKNGELIIFDEDERHFHKRFKFGDGEHNVIDLPFHISYPTTTTAGIVKSGGDVTISNGIISVNDDSHKHSISTIPDINTKIATNDSLGFVKGKTIRKEFTTSLYIINWCGSYNWYGGNDWSDLSLTPGTRFIVTHTSGPAKRPMSLGDGWNGYIASEGLFTDTVFTVDGYYSHIAIYDTELDSDGWELYEVIEDLSIGDVTINTDGTMMTNIPLTETSLSLKDTITGKLYTITIENGQIKATKV